MAKNDEIELEGIVKESLRGAKFIVEVELQNGQKHEITCSISGRMRQNYIRILEQDNVTVQVSPYDLTKGIITWRSK